MATRILHQQSNEEYHADLALGSSYVKDWNNRSPRHAQYGEKTINGTVRQNELETGRVVS